MGDTRRDWGPRRTPSPGSAHPRTAILYVRVDADDGAAADVGRQLDQLRALATARRWAALESVDNGYPGTTLRRPGLDDALARLSQGQAQILAVASLDRLTRSMPDLLHMLTQVKRHRWTLISLDPLLDSSTPSGRLTTDVLRAVGGWGPTDQVSSRRRGRPIELDEAIRARIGRERREGASLQAIADGLASDGVQTARGGRWHPSTIKRVLESLAREATSGSPVPDH